MSQHAIEVSSGQRFGFGENWSRFLAALNDERIARAEEALRQMLGCSDLTGKRFLDIGSGSGLHSLVARRLGAYVHSFDYDTQSVRCTEEMRRRYYPDDTRWVVEEGSALDTDYLQALGQFDVVYSWGVLHHTGAMWQALDNVHSLVAPGGKLFIAIYNDQGGESRRWKTIKRLYNHSPQPFKFMLVTGIGVYLESKYALARLARFKNPFPFKDWSEKKKSRGMTVWNDLVDWVGGYPFEVAKPEEIFDFYHARGFHLTEMKTCGGGFGCNEFVFEKCAE